MVEIRTIMKLDHELIDDSCEKITADEVKRIMTMSGPYSRFGLDFKLYKDIGMVADIIEYRDDDNRDTFDVIEDIMISDDSELHRSSLLAKKIKDNLKAKDYYIGIRSSRSKKSADVDYLGDLLKVKIETEKHLNILTNLETVYLSEEFIEFLTSNHIDFFKVHDITDDYIDFQSTTEHGDAIGNELHRFNVSSERHIETWHRGMCSIQQVFKDIKNDCGDKHYSWRMESCDHVIVSVLADTRDVNRTDFVITTYGISY